MAQELRLPPIIQKRQQSSYASFIKPRALGTSLNHNQTKEIVLKPRRKKAGPQLSILDQRILVLYNSKLRRINQDLARLNIIQKPTCSSECFHASVVIQRIYRGHRDRTAIYAFFGPRNQQKALIIQRYYRGHCGRQLVKQMRAQILYHAACRLQAWIRGILAREKYTLLMIDKAICCVVILQKIYRGYRARCIAAQLRLTFHTKCASAIQRIYRGHRGRIFVANVRFQNKANARAIALASEIHNISTRCKDCNWSTCTNDSLLMCCFARILGLYDLHGAKSLCFNGFQLFPMDPMFYMTYSILLQLEATSLEIAMTYLNKARALGLNEQHLQKCEIKFFYAALQWRPGDAVISLTFAIFLQCFNLFRRADSFYKVALNKNPQEYKIRHYLGRRAFSEAILLNFKRYLCIFKLPLNLRLRLTYKMFSLNSSEKMGVTCYRHNQYAVIVPDMVDRVNHIYLSEEEIGHLLNEVEDKVPTSTEVPNGQKRALIAIHRRRGTSALLSKEYTSQHDNKISIRLSIENADRIMNLIVFLPVSDRSNHYMMLIPSLLRWREQQSKALEQYEAVINIQRLFRGYLIRFQDARRRLLNRLTQQQMHKLHLVLLDRKYIQQLRFDAATRIQALYRGYQARQHLNYLTTATIKIQSIIRRELAKKRVIAIREGNLHLFPVVRVYNRGIELGGRHFLLSVDQSGLSFRFYGTDYVSCNIFSGVCPRMRTMQLLQYWRYEYAQSTVNEKLYYRGCFGKIDGIDTSKPHDIQVIGTLTDNSKFKISLLDAGMAIRTAQAAKRAKGNRNNATVPPPQLYPLPLDQNNITGIVAKMVENLALVPTMSMPTRQLQRESNRMTLAVVIPQQKSPLFLPSILPQKYPARVKNRLPPLLVRQTPKPYARVLRVNSTLQTNNLYRWTKRDDYVADNNLDQVSTEPIFQGAIYRQQCPRHSLTFARCKCFLFHVEASAASHLTALDMAMQKARPEDDQSRKNILENEIPNRSGRMWTRFKPKR